MIKISDEERMLYDGSCQKNLILNFSNETSLDNESIYTESMSLDESLCNESELTFGKCNPSCFKVRILATVASYKGLKLNPTLQVGNYVRSLGKFKIDSDSLTADKNYRDLIAYDALYDISKTDVSDWYNGLTFPMKLKAFRDSFFRYFGIAQETIVLTNDEMIVEKTIDANKLCGLDVIQSICEINGCFGHINVIGNFEYIYIHTVHDFLMPRDDLYPSDTLFPRDTADLTLNQSEYKQGSLKYEDYNCKEIDKVQIRQEENDIGVVVGEDGNTYIIEDNFLVYGKGTEELTTVAENFLEKARYFPFNPASVITRGKPYMQLGDIIRAIGMKSVVLFPILHRTLKGITALTDTYEAKSTEEYGDNVSGITYDVKQLKGKANILERSIEETKSTIIDVEQGLQSQITQTANSVMAEVSANYTSNQTMQEYVDDLQNQINGAVSSWSGTGIPTLQSYPTTEWQTAEYANHVNDVYINLDTGKNYRFVKDGETFKWLVVSDSDVTQLSNQVSSLSQTVNSISLQVTATSELIQGSYSTTEEMQSAIDQKANLITQSVSSTYQTKEDMSGYVDTETYSSYVTQTAESINSKVEKGSISSEISQESGKISISANRISISSSYFTLLENGAVTCSNLTVNGGSISIGDVFKVDSKGYLTAQKGTIAGFTIDKSAIYSNGKNYLGSRNCGVYVGTDGISVGYGAMENLDKGFTVTKDGNLYIGHNTQIYTGGSINFASSGNPYIRLDGKTKIAIVNSGIEVTGKIYCSDYLTVNSGGATIRGGMSVYSQLKAYDGLYVEDGITINNSGLSIKSGGLAVYGTTELRDNAVIAGSGDRLGFYGDSGTYKQRIYKLSWSYNAPSSSTIANKVNEIIQMLSNVNLIY